MLKGIRRLDNEEAARILKDFNGSVQNASNEPVYSLRTLKPTEKRETDDLIDFEITLSKGERVGLFR